MFESLTFLEGVYVGVLAFFIIGALAWLVKEDMKRREERRERKREKKVIQMMNESARVENRIKRIVREEMDR